MNSEGTNFSAAFLCDPDSPFMIEWWSSPTPVDEEFIRNLAPATRKPQNAEFLRALAILGGALFVLTLVSYLLTTNWAGAFPRDKATLVLGRDFLNLWMYGVAAFEPDPARYYDLATYSDALAKLDVPRHK